MAAPLQRAALVVVDMQNDFCEPNGTLAIPGGRSLATVINELLSWPGWDITVGTRDLHPEDHISFAKNHRDKKAFVDLITIPNPSRGNETQETLLWPVHCVCNTSGADFIDELHRQKLQHTVGKGEDRRVESYSAFGPPFRDPPVSMTGLHKILTGYGTGEHITHVFVVGLAYDFCVKHTALDAVAHGFETYVIEDATKAVRQDVDDLNKTRSELRAARVNIISSDAEFLRGIKDGNAEQWCFRDPSSTPKD